MDLTKELHHSLHMFRVWLRPSPTSCMDISLHNGVCCDQCAQGHLDGDTFAISFLFLINHSTVIILTESGLQTLHCRFLVMLASAGVFNMTLLAVGATTSRHMLQSITVMPGVVHAYSSFIQGEQTCCLLLELRPYTSTDSCIDQL